MRYKIIITAIMLSLIAPSIVIAQDDTVSVSKQNTNDTQFYVYLWDVTLSMRGPKRGGVADIWESTKEWLINEIESRNTNPNDTIVVCPFQECIIKGNTGLKRISPNEIVPRPYVNADDMNQSMNYDSPWKYPATKNGKRELINKIESFIQPHHGLTNLLGPLKDAERDYVDTSKYTTTIYMLTDGIDDFNEDQDEDFIEYVNKQWNDRKPLLIYYRLTDVASDKITPQKKVQIIDPLERLLEISISGSGAYNFKDAAEKNEKTYTFNVTQAQKNYDLPQGIKIRVKSQNNDFVKIDDVCEVIDGNIKVNLDYNQQTVDENILKDCVIDLNFHLENEKLKSGEYTYVISILNNSCKSLKLVNEIQRTLRIKLREAELTEN